MPLKWTDILIVPLPSRHNIEHLILQIFISREKSSGVDKPEIFLHKVFLKQSITFVSFILPEGGLILSNSSLQRAWFSQREL